MNISEFDKKKGVKQTTIKSYKDSAKIINKLLESNNVSIKKPNDVYKLLFGLYAKTTLNRHLNTIIEYIRIHRKKKLPKYLQKYEELRDNLKNDIVNTERTLTDKQKKIEYKKGIEKFINHIKNNDYETNRMEFITSFYILLEPRRRKDQEEEET